MNKNHNQAEANSMKTIIKITVKTYGTLGKWRTVITGLPGADQRLTGYDRAADAIHAAGDRVLAIEQTHIIK